jgi:hypothetical protein
MLPNEIKDLILSFCEGHVRADLRIKNVSVPLNIKVVGLDEKIIMSDCCLSGSDGMFLYIINKRDRDNLVGYISKMITEDKILYTWVKIAEA